MPFRFKDYGTFTGPNSFTGDYDYDATSQETSWPTDLPTDTSFKLTDLAMALVNDPANYVGFYCNGTATTLMTLAHSTGQIPVFKIESKNTIVNGKVFVNEKIICNGPITSNANIVANGSIVANGVITGTTISRLDAAIASKKGFDIQHPNKPNHRLRHICVEGPESAVYIRGKLEGKNVIELPNYWDGLIDPETISIQLTQIGHSQDLIVESIEWGKRVKIKSGNGTTVNCYYQIWADRLGEKLIVEYEGKTPNDYPGDNSEYSIAGHDYDRR
jgi:hypothetical protein